MQMILGPGEQLAKGWICPIARRSLDPAQESGAWALGFSSLSCDGSPGGIDPWHAL